MNTKQLLRNSNEDKETQSHKYILCEAKINFTELLFPIFHHIKQYISLNQYVPFLLKIGSV